MLYVISTHEVTMLVTDHFLLFALPKLTSRCTDSDKCGTDLQHRYDTIVTLLNTHFPIECLSQTLPGEMFSSLPMALFQTSPLTPGGSPCHHRSWTLRVL